jgi:protochlorophyllide reductase
LTGPISSGPAGSIVITGSSAGLGLAAAGDLAATGNHVVLAVRSPQRGAEAAAAIRARTPAASVEVVELDLASLSSVRSGAAQLLDGSRPPLRALVANAGIQVVKGVQTSADGFELTFATNHLGHFELIALLRDRLEPRARVVVVSSEVHQGPARSMGFPAPKWDSPRLLADPAAPGIDVSARGGRVRYATSKLANLYFTYELARRLDPDRVTVNAFDPGLMPETGLSREYPQIIQKLYRGISPVLTTLLPGARSVATSGADLAWLTTSPEVETITGAYFSGRKERRSSPKSHDQARARELWSVSEELIAAASTS